MIHTNKKNPSSINYSIPARDPQKEERRIWDFENGNYDLMISTDKLNRGLNLSNVKRIINWSPPYSLADYLNRCGRIGRLNQNHIGSVYTFVWYVNLQK